MILYIAGMVRGLSVVGLPGNETDGIMIHATQVNAPRTFIGDFPPMIGL